MIEKKVDVERVEELEDVVIETHTELGHVIGKAEDGLITDTSELVTLLTNMRARLATVLFQDK